jgi:hypothetical protein
VAVAGPVLDTAKSAALAPPPTGVTDLAGSDADEFVPDAASVAVPDGPLLRVMV